MRGINDQEILDFAALTLDRPLTIRFIEYMPAIRSDDWESRIVPGETILDRIGQRFSFTPLERDGLAGPARTFRIDGAAGTIGVITPVFGHFCGECNRIRVTATGTGLAAALRAIVVQKPGRHSLAETEQQYTPFVMSAIGG